MFKNLFIKTYVKPFTYLIAILYAQTSQASDTIELPDILVLGDSQITFGAGPAYLDFFQNLEKHCATSPEQSKALKKITQGSVGVIGVRSTTLQSWTGRSDKAKGKICDVDPKWKVNAASYGIINKTNKEYVQIGQGKQYQFCKKNSSAIEAIFRPN